MESRQGSCDTHRPPITACGMHGGVTIWPPGRLNKDYHACRGSEAALRLLRFGRLSLSKRTKDYHNRWNRARRYAKRIGKCGIDPIFSKGLAVRAAENLGASIQRLCEPKWASAHVCDAVASPHLHTVFSQFLSGVAFDLFFSRSCTSG